MSLNEQIVSFAFPLRFMGNGDIVISQDYQSLEQNMRSSALILNGSIPLKTEIGSPVCRLPFDPSDDVTKIMASMDVKDAIIVGEDRVQPLDPTVTEVEGNLQVSIPYKMKQSNDTWKVAQINIPVDGKSG
jgi:hypothetical protein